MTANNTTRMVKIKPASDLIVRDPITREPLKKTGETKPRTSYWIRRLADGSVIDMDKETTTKKGEK